MFNNLIFLMILYLIFALIHNQSYKVVTSDMLRAGALTVLVEGFAGLFGLLLMPLFAIKFPSKVSVYLFLSLACIFYALNDRLSTSARSGISVSLYMIIKQLSTVFMIVAGFLFFKEKFVLKKLIGALLIVSSNILVFYKKGNFKIDKYVIYGLLASLFYSVALFMDINYSKEFNLPFYVSFTLLVPALLIFIFNRVKIREIVSEFKNANKLLLFLTSAFWPMMLVAQLKAYMVGEVVVVASVCSVSVILNIIFGYLFLNEKDNLLKKIIGGILIIVSIIIINL